MSEELRERVARAMRDAYGEHKCIPWGRSETKRAWLKCADAAIRVLQAESGAEKMVGGKIIENSVAKLADGKDARRLWCVDRDGNECAVYADPSSSVLEVGEEIWWQCGKIYARGDTVAFDKIANSFDPR